MEQVQSAGRSSPTSRQHAYDRSRRFRDEAPAQPPFNPPDSLADEHHRVRNDDFLDSHPHTQDDSAFNADDGDPTEFFPNKSFVFTLFRMLQDDSLRDLIHWNREGNAFVIPDIEAFKTNALGRYFNGSYDNFVRKLNGYSFEKIGRSKTTATYKHKENKFLRDFTQLLRDIKRKGQQPEKPPHQGQPTSNPCAISNIHPLPQQTVPLDPERVLVLEQENVSLKMELQKREEAYKNLELQQAEREKTFENVESHLLRRLSDMHATVKGLEATVEDLRRSLQNTLSLRPSTLPESGSYPYKTPLPTSVHPPDVPQANDAGSSTNIAQIHMVQMYTVDRNRISAAFGNQSTPSGSRLPVDGLGVDHHHAMPTTALSSQHLRPTAEPSSMSRTDGLPVDHAGHLQPWSLIMDHPGQQGPSPGPFQQMFADACALPIPSNHHSSSLNGFASPSRGSPRALNLPMAVVHRRQPGDTTAPPGQSATSNYLSQTWPLSFFNCQ